MCFFFFKKKAMCFYMHLVYIDSENAYIVSCWQSDNHNLKYMRTEFLQFFFVWIEICCEWLSFSYNELASIPIRCIIQNMKVYFLWSKKHLNCQPYLCLKSMLVASKMLFLNQKMLVQGQRQVGVGWCTGPTLVAGNPIKFW